jgi:uncharacterized protein YjiS (DUF1127 family)
MNAEPFSEPVVARPPAQSLHAALRLLACWSARHRQRADLAELDDHLLADIGVTPQEARRECARPFWRRAPILAGRDVKHFDPDRTILPRKENGP